jgi:hypothetical protein
MLQTNPPVKAKVAGIEARPFGGLERTGSEISGFARATERLSHA